MQTLFITETDVGRTCAKQSQGGIMKRGQDREAGSPFRPAGVTLGHSVNLPRLFLLINEMGRLTTYISVSQDFCMRMHVKMFLWAIEPSVHVSADAVDEWVWEKGKHWGDWISSIGSDNFGKYVFIIWGKKVTVFNLNQTELKHSMCKVGFLLTKHFPYIISFDPQQHPMRQIF